MKNSFKITIETETKQNKTKNNKLKNTPKQRILFDRINLENKLQWGYADSWKWILMTELQLTCIWVDIVVYINRKMRFGERIFFFFQNFYKCSYGRAVYFLFVRGCFFFNSDSTVICIYMLLLYQVRLRILYECMCELFC